MNDNLSEVCVIGDVSSAELASLIRQTALLCDKSAVVSHHANPAQKLITALRIKILECLVWFVITVRKSR